MPYSLLFDIGNVIVSFDFQLTVNRIAEQCKLPADQIFGRVMELKDVLELGQISSEEFLAQASEMIGYSGDQDYLKQAFQEVFTANQPIIDLIEAQHAKGVPLYILSNTNGIHVPYLIENFPVFQRFDQSIYSHEVGLMKPDPKIYQETIKLLGLRPEQTIYLDDLPENCATGETFGFHTIKYDKSSHETCLDAFYEMVKKCEGVNS